MGTLERLRKTSPYALAAFAIIFIGFMVASDADIGSLMKQGTNFQTAAIGEINGEKILYKDFETKVRELVEQQKAQTKEGEEAQVDEVQIRRQVWQQMVDEVLLKQEAEKIGVIVTNDEILDVLFENPPEYLRKPFTDSAGRFQRDSYLEIITNPEVIMNRLPQTMPNEEKRDIVNSFRNDILKIEIYLKQSKLEEGLKNIVNSAATVVSPLYGKQKYINENSNAEVSFIQLDLKSIPDNSVKVSDQEIEQYYEKVSKYNKTKAKRKIKFVNFQLVPSAKDSMQSAKAIEKINASIAEASPISADALDSAFTKRMKEFDGQIFSHTLITEIPGNISTFISNLEPKQVVGPIQLPDGTYFFRLDDRRSGDNEVIKASHILINFNDNKDSAKAEAIRIMDLAKKGDFAAVAQQYSEDKGSAQNGGDLSYFGKGRMVKPFEDAAYAAKVGTIVGPVESQFGFHIIKVTDKKSDELKWSQIKVAVTLSRQTTKAITRDAKELKSKVEAGMTFDAACKALGKVPRETDFFEMDKPVFGSFFLSAQAFETEMGKVIEPIELKNAGIVVSQVIDGRDAGPVPLKDMKESIKTTLMKIKKLDALKSKAQALYNNIKNSGKLENAQAMVSPYQVKSAAGVLNNGTVPGLGQDFAFTEKVFMLPIGVISEPLRGELGYYIIQVNNKVMPDDNAVKSNIAQYMNTLKTTNAQMGYYQFMQKLKDEADIKDYRSKFLREY